MSVSTWILLWICIEHKMNTFREVAGLDKVWIVRYEVLMAVLLKMQVLSDMVLCCWASVQHFRGFLEPSSSGSCSPGRYFKRPEVCIQLFLTHFRMCPQFSLCFITCRHNNKATFLLRIWLFLWYKILPEKLVVTQLLTKTLPYMEQKGASGCIQSSVILQEKAQLIKTLEVYKEVGIVNYLCRYWTKSLTY